MTNVINVGNPVTLPGNAIPMTVDMGEYVLTVAEVIVEVFGVEWEADPLVSVSFLCGYILLTYLQFCAPLESIV